MKRTILGILLGVALSVGGFFIAARGIEGSVQVVRFWPIAAAIVAMVIAWLLQGIALAFLGRPQIGKLRVLGFTRAYLEAQAVGAITPFGGAEVPYQILKYEELDVPGAWGGAMLTVKSIFNGTILVAGGTVAVLFFSGLPRVNNWLLVAAFAAIILAWVLVAFLVSRSGGQKEESHEQEGGKQSWREKALGFVRVLMEDLVEIWRHDFRLVALCGVCMLGYWVMRPLLGVLALFAAGWSGENWPVVFGLQFVMYFVIPFSPTPGNSGAAEVLFVALMAPYVAQSSVLGGVLIWRALTYYSELVVGAFFAGRDVNEDIEVAKREFGSFGPTNPSRQASSETEAG